MAGWSEVKKRIVRLIGAMGVLILVVGVVVMSVLLARHFAPKAVPGEVISVVLGKGSNGTFTTVIVDDP